MADGKGYNFAAATNKVLLLKPFESSKKMRLSGSHFQKCRSHVNHMLHISFHHEKFLSEKMMSFSNSFYC